MALTALALESVGKKSAWHFPLLVLGLFGAALFSVMVSLRRRFLCFQQSKGWKWRRRHFSHSLCRLR
jgi:hypothetical protein